jgi:uncharacterized protein (DUF1684 family)
MLIIRHRHALHVGATICLLLGLAGRPAAAAEPTTPAYAAEIDAWHAARVQRLHSNTGWLTLVGLHDLDKARVNTVGSAPDALVNFSDKAPARVGVLAFADGQWTFTAEREAKVTLADSAATPVTTMAVKTDREGAPTMLSCGSLLFYVIEREDLCFLRVKDREAEVLRTFTGIDRFPVDAKWRVTARLEPGEALVKVPNKLGQLTDTPSPGVLVFELEGRTFHLTPTGNPGEELSIIFGDATNTHETYGGGRFLDTDVPAADGTVILDFNKAYNPPCVFTPYATCPLPGARNTLDLPVTAGEHVWGVH